MKRRLAARSADRLRADSRRPRQLRAMSTGPEADLAGRWCSPFQTPCQDEYIDWYKELGHGEESAGEHGTL